MRKSSCGEKKEGRVKFYLSPFLDKRRDSQIALNAGRGRGQREKKWGTNKNAKDGYEKNLARRRGKPPYEGRGLGRQRKREMQFTVSTAPKASRADAYEGNRHAGKSLQKIPGPSISLEILPESHVEVE